MHPWLRPPTSVVAPRIERMAMGVIVSVEPQVSGDVRRARQVAGLPRLVAFYFRMLDATLSINNNNDSA